jgi:hypothetical protein
MKTELLHNIRTWFETYVATYIPHEGKLHPFLLLKQCHSRRVAENARQLAARSGWSPAAVNSAEALGWLHDVGRFSQFTEFSTFSDSISFNHGRRGQTVVQHAGILDPLARDIREALLYGIGLHNARTMPENLGRCSQQYLELIRDADKLDILLITLDSVRKDGFRSLPEMLPHVQLDGAPSPGILYEIRHRQTCNIENLRTLADFMLMQLSWLYDLNLSAAYSLVAEHHIIDKFHACLPDTRPVRDVVQAIRHFVKKHRR